MHRSFVTVTLGVALVGVAALLSCPDLSAQTLSVPASLGHQVDEGAAAMVSRLVETRRDIHRHPELGFREKRTADLVARRLQELGFDEVRTGIGVTGVVGILKGGKPGKVVALRADMDALPIPELNDVPYKSTVENVKHACGHDAHVAIALGVAELLSGMRAEIPGTVMVFFQPAEEGDPDGGDTGALRMLQDGLFAETKPEAVFGLHVMPTLDVGTIGYNVGSAMASSDRFKISIVGQKTHAAYPHTGLDPVPIAAEVILALQTIPSRLVNATTPTVVSVGAIHGGNRFNIIADRVELEGTVRTLTKEGSGQVKALMESLVKGMTSGYGAQYEFEYEQKAPVTYNDPDLTTASLPVLEAIVGKDALVVPPPQMGAEDFAFYQQETPGFYYFLGVRNEARNITAMIHTEQFDLDEEALPIGVRAMSTLLLDFLFRQ
ncbi:MAG: amidohydrolase [Luteitalea sp.]|nr:amidohydrolase [Luteitalea sp.]